MYIAVFAWGEGALETFY